MHKHSRNVIKGNYVRPLITAIIILFVYAFAPKNCCVHEFGDCVINLRSVCIILQGVWLASLIHSLLVHGFHLYILHGRLLRHAWYISNNEQWFKDQVCDVISDLTSLTTNYLFPPFSQSACEKNSLTL